MRRIVVFFGLAAAAATFVTWWRGHRRFGASYVNRVVDPWLVRQGLVAKSAGELGLIEHVGRKSGTVRITPVHPVPTETGFRIIVPLAEESHWAQNVLAAGHCRLELDGEVYELDEPALVSPGEMEDLPPMARRLQEWLGFRYLLLRRFAQHPGTLQAPAPEEEPAVTAEREAAATA